MNFLFILWSLLKYIEWRVSPVTWFINFLIEIQPWVGLHHDKERPSLLQNYNMHPENNQSASNLFQSIFLFVFFHMMC
jgi:hypothetical protein